ncbi:MAG: hypothetical protein EAZ07_07010 [Cytophagales bacterium]|nr:MAG: hypothetical protein EAZ07_07010 [Cytophagales bacterium]
MKFIVSLFLLVSLSTFIQSVKAQESSVLNPEYDVWKKNGVGIAYGGGSLWLNYKHYFSKFALEGNFGYYRGGTLGFIPRFQINVMKHYTCFDLKDIQFYWGLGAHYQIAEKPYYKLGINALIGFEFNIIKAPLSIFTDAGVEPSYRGKSDSGFKWSFPARLGLRFRW